MESLSLRIVEMELAAERKEALRVAQVRTTSMTPPPHCNDDAALHTDLRRLPILVRDVGPKRRWIDFYCRKGSALAGFSAAALLHPHATRFPTAPSWAPTVFLRGSFAHPFLPASHLSSAPPPYLLHSG